NLRIRIGRYDIGLFDNCLGVRRFLVECIAYGVTQLVFGPCGPFFHGVGSNLRLEIRIVGGGGAKIVMQRMVALRALGLDCRNIIVIQPLLGLELCGFIRVERKAVILVIVVGNPLIIVILMQVAQLPVILIPGLFRSTGSFHTLRRGRFGIVAQQVHIVPETEQFIFRSAVAFIFAIGIDQITVTYFE